MINIRLVLRKWLAQCIKSLHEAAQKGVPRLQKFARNLFESWDVQSAELVNIKLVEKRLFFERDCVVAREGCFRRVRSLGCGFSAPTLLFPSLRPRIAPNVGALASAGCARASGFAAARGSGFRDR